MSALACLLFIVLQNAFKIAARIIISVITKALALRIMRRPIHYPCLIII